MIPKEFDRKISDPLLQLEAELSGYCPVQAYGRIVGREFYFRSRHEEWTFAVASGAVPDPVDIFTADQGFFRKASYGKREEAGWMPLDEAERIIRECAAEFVKTVRT